MFGQRLASRGNDIQKTQANFSTATLFGNISTDFFQIISSRRCSKDSRHLFALRPGVFIQLYDQLILDGFEIQIGDVAVFSRINGRLDIRFQLPMSRLQISIDSGRLYGKVIATPEFSGCNRLGYVLFKIRRIVDHFSPESIPS
jgi:hypothetical protein